MLLFIPELRIYTIEIAVYEQIGETKRRGFIDHTTSTALL